MRCEHPNPPGRAYCSTCGIEVAHQLCRCGFTCEPRAAFCGRCGSALAEDRSRDRSADGSMDAGKYDLKLFLGLAPEEVKREPEEVETKLSRDEIKKLLKKRAAQT